MKRISIIFLLCALGAGISWWSFLPKPMVEVIIPQGASVREASHLLHSAGVLASPSLFRALLMVSGKTKDIKAGTYLISPRTLPFTVIGIVTKGRVNARKVTIPEGFNAKQIAERLEAAGVVQAEEFLGSGV